MRTILIGGLLAVLSFLVIPAVFLMGYMIRVLRGTADGIEEPPVFDDWASLGTDGVKAILIAVAYLLVPAAVFGLLVGASAATIGPDAGAANVAGLLGGLLISGAIALAFWYALPAALASFARRSSVRAAFDAGELKTVLTSPAYAKGWLVALGVLLVAGIVVGLLSVVPIVGTIAGLFVNFYAMVVAYYLYGRAYADATAVEGAEMPAGRQAAA